MAINLDKVADMIDKGKPTILEQLSLDPLLWADLRETDPKVITPALHNELNVAMMDEMTKITKLLDDIRMGPVNRFLKFCVVMKKRGKPQVLEALGVDMVQVERQLGPPQEPSMAAGQTGNNVPQEPPRAAGQDSDFVSRMTVIADKVKEELLKDRVRLQGRTGIRIETSLRGYIDQWEIIEYTSLEEVKAMTTGARAVEKLIDYLQQCRRRSVILFLRALFKLDMAHQLKTIDKEDKEFVGQGEDKEMLKRLEDLD